MTTPIKPEIGRVPPLPPTKEAQGKTKDIAGKVSQVTGGTGSPEVRNASVPITTAKTLSGPDPKTMVAAVKKQMDLETLLQITKPVRDIILNDLSDDELKAFEIALSKGTTLEDRYKEAFPAIKKQITQIKHYRNEQLLQEILTDHPDWKGPIEAWKTVSLENKIWLCQIYELFNLGINISQIDALHKGVKRPLIPSLSTPNLLESEKKYINETLSKHKQLYWNGKNLQKCPKAIGLLVNLEKLILTKNQLTVPPDVSRNTKLQELHLGNNMLTVPPDVSRNVKLTRLYLFTNQLTASPDIRCNTNLQTLDLYWNQLTVPPDVSRNTKLQELNLANNKLTAPPDISRNVDLQTLTLRSNPLTTQTRETLAKLKSDLNRDFEILY